MSDEIRLRIWAYLMPYIASEDVEYSEKEMEYLCESVLPSVWSLVLKLDALKEGDDVRE